MRFKIDWASLTVGTKFTVFALFYFVFEDKIGKIFSYFGYPREHEGQAGRGGGFMVSIAGIIRTMTRLITPPSSIKRNTFALYLPKTS